MRKAISRWRPASRAMVRLARFGARDQQHEPHRRIQNDQPARQFPVELAFRQWHGAGIPDLARSAARLDALQAAHDSLHFGRRLRRRHTGLGTRDDLEPVLLSIRHAALAGHRHGHPQIRTPRIAFESLGCHADDGERSIVEANRFADPRRTGRATTRRR
jgi:hypothetical protein